MPAMTPEARREHRAALTEARRHREPAKSRKARRKTAARLKRQRHRDNVNPLVKVQRRGHIKRQRLIVIRRNAASRIAYLLMGGRWAGESDRFKAQAKSIRRVLA